MKMSFEKYSGRYSVLVNPLLVVASIIFLCSTVCSCSKSAPAAGAASLSIVNALQQQLIVNFNEQDTILYASGGSGQVINGGSSLEFAVSAGPQLVNLHEYVYDLITWKGVAVAKGRFQFSAGDMCSLFIGGTLDEADTMMIKDVPLRFLSTDSSMGIRFVNLSGDGRSVNIFLQAEPGRPRVENLQYKEATGFDSYSANSMNENYVFEIRDVISGNVLATAVLNNINLPGTAGAANLWRRKNFSIVYCGSPDTGQQPPTVFVVKNH